MYVAKFSPVYKEAAQQLLSKFTGMTPALKGTASIGKRTDEEAVEILGRCEARGFEKPLLPLMNIRRPRTSVSRLLDLQNRLVQDCCEEKERVEVLARQYHEDTQSDLVWARLLADGDAMFMRKRVTHCL